jgi:hypothetical protein
MARTTVDDEVHMAMVGAPVDARPRRTCRCHAPLAAVRFDPRSLTGALMDALALVRLAAT